MKMRSAIAGTRISGRLMAIGCAAVLASASVSACTGGTPSGTPTSFAPGGSPTGTGTATPTGTATATATGTATASASGSSASASANAQASKSATPTPSTTTRSAGGFPTAAPETGGGGTAGFQDTLLVTLGGAAILAGAGSIVYRRRVIRNR